MITRRPGEWPVPPTEITEVDEQGEQHLAVVRVQARFHVTLGAIRADLEEQPSNRSVRSAAKRWHDAITALTDEVITERKRAG